MEKRNTALRLKKGHSLPEGAIALSMHEALEMNKRRLEKWEPKHEAWSLRYGPELASIAASIAGGFLVHHYRNVFRLGNYGIGACVLAGVVLPAPTAYLAHTVLVTEKIMQSDAVCVICTETRSGIAQTLVGGIYPFLVTSLMCSIQAKNAHTYPVAAFTEKKEVLKMIKTTAPVKRLFGGMLLAQFSLGMFLANQEWNFFEKKMMRETGVGLSNNFNEDITFS